jgi:hypothetical protein
MSDRTTHEFTTPSGHKIVFNSYLTGREAQELKGLMLAVMKVNTQDVQSGKIDVPSTFIVDQEKRAFEYLIVSFDGSTETPVEKLLALPSSEYEAVVQEVNRIQNPTKPQK